MYDIDITNDDAADWLYGMWLPLQLMPPDINAGKVVLATITGGYVPNADYTDARIYDTIEDAVAHAKQMADTLQTLIKEI